MTRHTGTLAGRAYPVSSARKCARDDQGEAASESAHPGNGGPRIGSSEGPSAARGGFPRLESAAGCPVRLVNEHGSRVPTSLGIRIGAQMSRPDKHVAGICDPLCSGPPAP